LCLIFIELVSHTGFLLQRYGSCFEQDWYVRTDSQHLSQKEYTITYYSLVPVPAQWTKDGTFHHTMEGEDDMPGHVKSSLMGPSLNIPVSTWTCGLRGHSNTSSQFALRNQHLQFESINNADIDPQW
jgi:hypothetical protein